MMASQSVDSNGAKETILLRKPVPRYQFEGRKLPKTNEAVISEPILRPPVSHKSNNVAEESFASAQNTLATVGPYLPASTQAEGQRATPSKPIAVVEASFKTFHSPPVRFGLQEPLQTQELKRNESLTIPVIPNSLASHTNLSNIPTDVQSESIELKSSFEPNSQNPTEVCQSQTARLPENSQMTTNISSHEAASKSSFPPSLEHQLAVVREERDKFKAELNAQIQVNTELKRLLVASVGDDLYQRVENLCRDRAQLELDLGGFSKKMSEDYENLDKISIQADMWRSKYLASRVMTEELSSAKAYLNLQCHDSHSALQQMLNERQELRTNLVEGYKVLQQVKNAFDPLNTHRSSSLRSTNVLDLSQSCQQLAEAVRYRLLPSHVVIDVSADVSEITWKDCNTRAEIFAHEVLSRPIETGGSHQPGLLATKSDASPGQLSRYHPATRFENLTMNCCALCRGELQVI